MTACRSNVTQEAAITASALCLQAAASLRDVQTFSPSPTTLEDIELADNEVNLAAYYACGALEHAKVEDNPALAKARDRLLAACDKATATRRAYLNEYDQRIAAIAAKAGAAAC